ncbi:MAG: MBOAT family protein [Syntrophobacteraceae bacterium]
MVFHSPVFLLLFLPLIAVLCLLVPKESKNLLLLSAGLFFYAWGDANSLHVLILYILTNYLFGLIIDRSEAPRLRAVILALSLGLNITLLLFYKYSKFIIVNLAGVNMADPVHFDFTDWRLPLGISFFTFAAIAYQVDIYRRKVTAERNLVDFGLFLSHFAKVIAGPIVRYTQMAGDLKTRHPRLEQIAGGIRRFVTGLGKKVLIAGPAAVFADEVFKNPGGIDMPTAWLGILCYTIQIYFDFSGYSDMAIGLGHIWGFCFIENFNYPYISRSIQEFWRRWHISLSSWFRDYLYIPLGGNRVSKIRTYCNLLLVFLLCGLWHGASWNFIVWGGYHGVFLAAERAGLAEVLLRLPKFLRHLYSLLVVMIGWVFFRADDLSVSFQYLRAMFSFTYDPLDYWRMTFLTRQLILVLMIGIIGSTPAITLPHRLHAWIGEHSTGYLRGFAHLTWPVLTTASIIVLFIASAMQIANTTFTPFIYAKF